MFIVMTILETIQVGMCAFNHVEPKEMSSSLFSITIGDQK